MILINLITAPFISYFMTLFWAALFGNSFGSELMLEEWIICLQIYFFVLILYKFKPSRTNKDE